MQKKNILFIIQGSKIWIGGIYYIKNIVYSLLQLPKARECLNIFLYIPDEWKEIFEGMDSVIFLKNKNTGIAHFLHRVFLKIFKRGFDFQLLQYCWKYNIHQIYPVVGYPYLFLGKKTIYWIPDFQHKHLSAFFLQREIQEREKRFAYMAKVHKKLVLSSQDALKDYTRYYPLHTKGIFVVPFVSAIEKEAEEAEKLLSSVLEKYQIPAQYFLLPNQFWAHKNHTTVFKAMDILINQHKTPLYLVCTGYTTDYRNKSYFQDLQKFLKEKNIEEYIKIIGFIDRKEQIALYMGAKAVLQPSLFEGWSTVVEDAKALQKQIILSDIPVHIEQSNSLSTIFPRYDYERLANIMKQIREAPDTVIKKMDKESLRSRAKEYAEKFYECFQS